MHLSVLPTPEAVHDRTWLRDRIVVVVDVLRASSTMVTALVNGCRGIVPVEDATEAVDMTRTLDDALLCGERGGQMIPGFVLGNSPHEYTAQTVAGRTLILSTTNGTKAVARAREARLTLIGSLLNAQALAEALCHTCEKSPGEECFILCSGTNGRFSLDDILCAGAIAHRLDGMRALECIDDAAAASLTLYRAAKDELEAALRATAHGCHLTAIGAGKDITYCAREDIYDAVPWMQDGIIRL